MPDNLCRRALGALLLPRPGPRLSGVRVATGGETPGAAGARAARRRRRARRPELRAGGRSWPPRRRCPTSRTPQQAILEENASWMSSGAMKELEERQKRELSARERSGIMEMFGAQRSLLRDALMMASGSQEEPCCDDFARTAQAYACRLGTDGLLRAPLRASTGRASASGPMSRPSWPWRPCCSISRRCSSATSHSRPHAFQRHGPVVQPGEERRHGRRPRHRHHRAAARSSAWPPPTPSRPPPRR